MASIFESTAKVAIREMIANHAKESKFGYILSREAAQALTNDLLDLLHTSRNLKTAGDKMLAGGLMGSEPVKKR